MSNSYKYKQARRSSGKRIEVPVTDEMRKLVPTSKIYINAERDTIYVYNGKTRPVTAPIGGDALTDTDLLKQKIIETFKIKEDAVVEWIGLLSDQLLELERSDSEDEDEDQGKKLVHYIHKYSTGIPLAEAILIENTEPKFLQKSLTGKLCYRRK